MFYLHRGIPANIWNNLKELKGLGIIFKHRIKGREKSEQFKNQNKFQAGGFQIKIFPIFQFFPEKINLIFPVADLGILPETAVGWDKETHMQGWEANHSLIP